MEEKVISEIKAMGEMISEIKKNAESKSAEVSAALEAKLAEYKAAAETKSAEELKAIQKEMQDQYDAFVSKRGKSKEVEQKFIDTEIVSKLSGINFKEGVDNDLTNELRAKRSFRIDLNEVKAMGLSNNLSGDPVATYGPRQAILPSQKVNFRDLMPTFNTETGLYVFYKETATPNNIAVQSEGSTKAENTYALSEVKIVSNYIAGTTTFTKQMATSLPFLSQVLPQMLMRDYFKKENDLFYATVSGLATPDTSTESDNVKKIIDFIAAQQQLNYNASYVVVSYNDMASLIKSTYSSGYYAGAGLVALGGQNGITINGVPVVAASWATTGKALVIDQDFLQRVQVKGLAIELSYENNDNFVKNQVTARIECQTEVNLMLAASASFGTLA